VLFLGNYAEKIKLIEFASQIAADRDLAKANRPDSHLL